MAELRWDCTMAEKEKAGMKDEKARKAAIDGQYPPWPVVDYRLQGSKFFEEVRHLPASGVDPRSEHINDHVTGTDIASVFGNVKKYRTTNPMVSEEHLKELLNLYWRIYGTGHVTNNGFAAWVIKGWIAERKNVAVDWARAAAKTAKEKERRVGLVSSSRGLDVETSGLSDWSLATERKSGEPHNTSGPNKVVATSTWVPSHADIAAVERVLELKRELTKLGRARVKQLQDEKLEVQDRVIGARFTLTDRKVLASDSERSIRDKKVQLAALEEQMMSQMHQDGEKRDKNEDSAGLESAEPLDNSLPPDQSCDSFLASKSCLQRELEKLETLHDDKRLLAIQGDALLEQAENESLELDIQVGRAKQDVLAIRKEEAAVTSQLQQMVDGGGMSFWPKPIIHPEQANEDETNFLIIRPCGFCGGSFHCYDIVVTSCKHTFHPFCLGAMLTDGQECCVCKTTLHPHWWRSFGIRKESEEITELASSLELGAAEEAMFTAWIAAAKTGLHNHSIEGLSSDALYTELGSNTSAEVMSPKGKENQATGKLPTSTPNSSTHSTTSLPCVEGGSADAVCASPQPISDKLKRKRVPTELAGLKKQKSLDFERHNGRGGGPREAPASANPCSANVPAMTSTHTEVAGAPSVPDSCPSDMPPSVVEELLLAKLLQGGCASSGQTIADMLKAYLAKSVTVPPTPMPLQIDDSQCSLPSQLEKPPKAGSTGKSRGQPAVKTVSTRADDKGKKPNTRSRLSKV